MAELAEGFRFLQRNNFEESFNLARLLLDEKYEWPSAHFLAGKSCSLNSNCPRDIAMQHLKTCVEIKPDEIQLSTKTTEPELPLKYQLEALKLWLVVASQGGFEGASEFHKMAKHLLKLDPTNQGVQLLCASWIPSHIQNSTQGDQIWNQYEKRMNKLISGEGGEEEKDSMVGDEHFQLIPGSLSLEDPLLTVAYSLQFFHAYLHHNHTRRGLELFAHAIDIGLNSSHFQKEHPFSRDSSKKTSKRNTREKTIATKNNEYSVCFVSSYLHGGHQLVRIFDEVIRRLPHQNIQNRANNDDEGGGRRRRTWIVSVAHVSSESMYWKQVSPNKFLLMDNNQKQYLVDDNLTIIPLPRQGRVINPKEPNRSPIPTLIPSSSNKDASYLDSTMSAFLIRSTHAITSRNFNVVVFTEIGMDLHIYLLAHNRLAIDAQLSAWGHPVTSGLKYPTLDATIVHGAALRPVESNGSEDYGSLLFFQQNQYAERVVSLSAKYDREYRLHHVDLVNQGNVKHMNRKRTRYDQRLDNGELVEVSAITGRPIPTKLEIWEKLGIISNNDDDDEDDDAIKVISLLQSSQKIHPDFDKILLNITDTNNKIFNDYKIKLIILDSHMIGKNEMKDTKFRTQNHQHSSHDEVGKIENRLLNHIGSCCEDVIFVKHFLPHEEMLAVFRYSHLSLDAFYFGGDGTTREALEMGCPVVTLPSLGLGSKWSASLYYLLKLKPIKLDEIDPLSNLQQNDKTCGERDMVLPNGDSSSTFEPYAPIASNKQEYLELIYLLLSNKFNMYDKLRRALLDRVPSHLFHRDDAVEAWSVLLKSEIDRTRSLGANKTDLMLHRQQQNWEHQDQGVDCVETKTNEIGTTNNAVEEEDEILVTNCGTIESLTTEQSVDADLNDIGGVYLEQNYKLDETSNLSPTSISFMFVSFCGFVFMLGFYYWKRKKKMKNKKYSDQ